MPNRIGMSLWQFVNDLGGFVARSPLLVLAVGVVIAALALCYQRPSGR